MMTVVVWCRRWCCEEKKGEGTGECEESRGGEVVLAVGVAAAVLD
jgi:hypothetical protein